MITVLSLIVLIATLSGLYEFLWPKSVNRSFFVISVAIIFLISGILLTWALFTDAFSDSFQTSILAVNLLTILFFIPYLIAKRRLRKLIYLIPAILWVLFWIAIMTGGGYQFESGAWL